MDDANHRHVIAVDPGEHGYIAVLDTVTDDLSCYSIKGDTSRIVNDFPRFIALGALIAIEDVHAIFGSAAQATFSFGRNLGFVEGLLRACGVDLDQVLRVPPGVWQSLTISAPSRPNSRMFAEKKAADKAKRDHKASVKNASITAAKATFPDTEIVSSDMADAINIARYALKVRNSVVLHKNPPTTKEKRIAKRKRKSKVLEVTVGSTTVNTVKDTRGSTITTGTDELADFERVRRSF